MAAVVPWCASSASSSSSSGRSLRPSSASRTPLVSPFLGSVQGRVSLVHSVRKAPSLKVGKSFQVRCQEAVIPKEQRWMFEPSEIDGPVSIFSLFSSMLVVVLFLSLTFMSFTVCFCYQCCRLFCANETCLGSLNICVSVFRTSGTRRGIRRLQTTKTQRKHGT